MADLSSWLLDRRQLVEARLAEHDLLHTLSAARYQLKREVEQAIDQYATGRVLEAGAGRSPYRRALNRKVHEVVTLDLEDSRDVDFVADVQDMAILEDESFDTVLSTQVLEHIPRPQDAMREMSRVLRPGGILILTAPHLSMVHEAPHDYFRYTKFGLCVLSSEAGLEVLALEPVGGVLSFLSHLASLFLLTVVGALPGLFWTGWALNYVLFVRGITTLESLMGIERLARDGLLIARRPMGR